MSQNNPKTVELLDHHTGRSYKCGTLVIAKSKAAQLESRPLEWHHEPASPGFQEEWLAFVEDKDYTRFTVYL